MTPRRAAASHREQVLLGAGIVLLAMNLRPAAAAVGPLLPRIRVDTGLSGLGAGLLAALPVFCFGAVAPLGPVLVRRVGTRPALVVALAVLVGGLALRLVPGLAFLFAGTALAGAAIAVANVLLPVLVRRNFPSRIGGMTGLYATALIGMAAVAAAVAVPVADAFGGGWRGGLGIWAAPAAAVLAFWAFGLRLRARRPEPLAEASAAESSAGEASAAEPTGEPIADEPIAGLTALVHDRLAWALTLFFALQSAGFYATLAWLPSVFRSHGASETQAGVFLGISLVVGVATALTVPTIATRARDQRALVVAFTSCAALGWLGVLVAPMSAPYLWSALVGLGLNALFPLALTLIVLRSPSVASTAGLSTLVQTVGYVLAAFAPLAIGALHDATGSWTTPVVVLLALLVPQAVTGLVAGRRGHVGALNTLHTFAVDTRQQSH